MSIERGWGRVSRVLLAGGILGALFIWTIVPGSTDARLLLTGLGFVPWTVATVIGWIIEGVAAADED